MLSLTLTESFIDVESGINGSGGSGGGNGGNVGRSLGGGGGGSMGRDVSSALEVEETVGTDSSTYRHRRCESDFEDRLERIFRGSRGVSNDVND